MKALVNLIDFSYMYWPLYILCCETDLSPERNSACDKNGFLELEDLRNKQMKNTITEMKNTLEKINSRINEAEEQISELEDRMVEITAAE